MKRVNGSASVCRWLWSVLWIAGPVFAFQPPVMAGETCPVDAAEIGAWDMDSGEYADIWAEGDVAFVGEFFDNKVHFFDVSDPTNPVRFLEWTVGAPNQFASAQDVKTGDGLLFISLESDPNDGVEIVDISDPFNPQHLSWVDTPGMSGVHNTFYDNGYLYLVNSGNPSLAVVDLTNFDPANPPVRIQQNLWSIQVGSSFVHDITVRNGILYACAWDSGLHVFDVSNIANAPPVFLGAGAGDNTHAVWPSDDGRWAVASEERTDGPVKLYEIIPNGGGADVVLRDTLTLPSNVAHSAHNPVVIGTRAYVSWYQAGLRILDIDETLAQFVEVGGYDTFGGGVFGFDGAWGVYPFLGEDRLLVSDLSNGLSVIRTQPLVSIDFPNGLVGVIDPINGADLVVQISSMCGSPDPGTARVIVGMDGDDVEIPLNPIGNDLFEAVLPPAPCGTGYSYYVAIDTADGGTSFDPPGAPANRYEALVATTFELLFTDDMETDSGWVATSSVCDAPQQTGEWERVDPIGTGSAPEDDYPGGEGTMCYVTEQGLPGDSDGAADVDGGPFVLTSPTITIDNSDVVVSYARWFASTSGDDTFRVEISTDGGQTWSLVEVLDGGGPEWILAEFLLSDVVAVGPTLNLRFTVQDCPNNSITEAAVDAISITLVVCEDTDATPPAIVHDGGVSTNPFSGYIDPRRESADGTNVDQGIDTVTIAFTEPVFNIGGGDLDPSAFSVTSTGAPVPNVSSIDAAGNPEIVLSLSQPLTPGSWYTIIADVQDLAGNAIENLGNAGPGVNEPDRVDIAFLPADVDQSGVVSPLDLLRFKQFINEIASPEQGTLADYLDIDRNATINPLDLLAFKRLVNGISPATQVWGTESLDAPRP